MRGVKVRPGDAIRGQDVLVFAASLPLLVVSAYLVWGAGFHLWRDACLVALGVTHLSLLVRSRWPWVTLVATGVGTLALLASPHLPEHVTTLPGPLPAVLLPSSVLFGVAIYSVAAHARSYRRLAILAGVAGAAEVTAALWSGIPWLLAPTIPEAWRVAVGIVGTLATLLAYNLGRRRAVEAAYDDLGRRWDGVDDERISRNLDHVVVQQQARMAREVHQAVAEQLDDIVDKARDGRRAARRAPALAADALTDIANVGEEALGRVHSLLALLDAPDPEEAMATEASTSVLAPEHALSPQPQLSDLPRLMDAARGEGLAVTLDITGDRGDLPVAAQLALYRTVQEALTNTVRHAGPGAVAHVEIAWDSDEVAAVVEDEVRGGTEPASLDAGLFRSDGYVEGRGLRVVRERLEALEGYLEVDPVDGGYHVRGVVPRDVRSTI